ncbi:hypothetical protein [Spirochaeta isovalerica]|uniref:PEGA domain-containing protein n=1 Tax=Spirochaeta isovalerica TaxID=150 RepID=A0A841R379_9SPIO|nr:hypothetical protein [Spirochaeta isovalerica]MBB6479504.1 hypothetical protein [Spirochaeta isovalerica]
MKRLLFLLIFIFSFPLFSDDTADVPAADEGVLSEGPDSAVVIDDTPAGVSETADAALANPETAEAAGPESPAEPDETETSAPDSPTGTILLRPTGASGGYTVYIDGEEAGSDLKVVNVEPGEHLVEIRQKRLRIERVLLTENVTVPAVGSAEFTFTLPDMLGSEETVILDLKRRIERAIDNKESLFDLRDEITSFLEQMPDWMEDKPVLEDYRLKILIELEQRRATTNFIFGDMIDLSFFMEDYDFIDYELHTTPASFDFKWALKYVLILKRLQMLQILMNRDFELYGEQLGENELLLALAGRVTPDFAEKYRTDFQSINNMYLHFIGEKRIPDRRNFQKQLAVRYGSVWESLESIKSSDILPDSRDVLAIKAAYSSMDLSVLWNPDMLKSGERPLKFNLTAGGGALLTAGLFWEPRPWFALNVGVSGTYDFINRSGEDDWLADENPSMTFSIPVELDFFIVNRKLEIFLGITADIFRLQNKPTIHWSNGFARDAEGFQTGSVIAFWTAVGINAGIGLDLGKVDIYLSNYFYITDFSLDSFNIDSIRYSPAIGVRL